MGTIGALTKVGLAAVALASAIVPAWAEDAGAVRCKDVASIGVATMDANGVLSLALRSLGPGPIAEGVLVYHPRDKDYEKVLAHLGRMRPGETKPVKPWC